MKTQNDDDCSERRPPTTTAKPIAEQVSRQTIIRRQAAHSLTQTKKAARVVYRGIDYVEFRALLSKKPKYPEAGRNE
jgi:hypothetical protein